MPTTLLQKDTIYDLVDKIDELQKYIEQYFAHSSEHWQLVMASKQICKFETSQVLVTWDSIERAATDN